MSTSDTWSEVRRVFQEASERHGADRDAWLARVPPGPVLDEVRSLLEWHVPDTDFLETSAAAPFTAAAPPVEDLIGVTLGAWRIEGRIGAGGMGVVYRARDRADCGEMKNGLATLDRFGERLIIENRTVHETHASGFKFQKRGKMLEC